MIGACKEHIRYVEQLRAVGAPPTAIEVTNSNGQPPGSMRGYGKKTLGTAIREVEDHYAKKNGES